MADESGSRLDCAQAVGDSSVVSILPVCNPRIPTPASVSPTREGRRESLRGATRAGLVRFLLRRRGRRGVAPTWRRSTRLGAWPTSPTRCPVFLTRKDLAAQPETRDEASRHQDTVESRSVLPEPCFRSVR